MNKLGHHAKQDLCHTLSDRPFERLVISVPELKEARREYASKSPKKRRAAAEWAYDSSVAQDLFSRAVAGAGRDDSMDSGFDSGVVALAIDPLFAPALLTVGSWKYQFGRTGAAMELFMTLVTLPEAEPDLAEIIDKAGSFLLDEEDIPNAIRLYRAATEAYPGVCEHWSNLSHCLGEAGELEEAVTTARRALSLKEDDPMVLNDLGWTLVLAGLHDEARSVLERAVALARTITNSRATTFSNSINGCRRSAAKIGSNNDFCRSHMGRLEGMGRFEGGCSCKILPQRR